MPYSSIKKSWISALTISGLYLFAGLIWIYFSDRIRLPFIVDKETLTVFQTYKGAGYVIVTAFLLYMLIYRQIRKRAGLILLLRKRNRLLTRVLQNQQGMNVLIVGLNGGILQAYGEDVLWAGTKTSKLVGYNFNQWVGNDEEKENIQHFYKSLWEKGNAETELRIKSYWYLFSGTLLNRRNTGDDYALIVTRRINNEKLIQEEKETLIYKCNALNTKLREFEIELDYQKKRFNAFTDNIGEGVVLCSINRSGQIDEVELINQKAISCFGLVSREYDKEGLWKRLRFKGRDDINLLLNNNFRERQRIILYAATFNDSSEKEIELTAHYFFLERRSHVMILMRESDIDIKNTINKTPAIYDALAVLNSLSDGAMLLYPDFRIYFCNVAMKKILGIENCEEEGFSVNSLIQKDIDIDVTPYLDETLNGNVTKTSDFNLSGSAESWYNSVFYPIFDKNGNVKSILRLTQDITYRREYEMALSEQQNLVDESSRLKSIFLSNLSHEVRTPMNGILGFVEVLEQEGLTESQNYHLKLIRESCDNLLNILNILIQVSRLENGEVVADKSWFDAMDLVNYLESQGNELLKKSGKRNLQYNFDVSSVEPLGRIFSDKDILIEIMRLLLDNAVKFTQEGYVKAGMQIVKEDSLMFWIEDTGVGINKSIHSNIYLPFTTISDSESVLYGGLGLGLTIVKALIELLGGTIELDSEPGKGSRFVVIVPLRVAKEINQSKGLQEKGSVLNVRKILIVQYGYERMDELKSVFNHHKVKVEMASNGSEAIDILFDQKDVDAVITDIRLSDMDGYELLKAIRKMYPALPVIAQASYLIPEEKQRCLREGFDEYLVKPVDASQLFKVLSQY